MPEQSQEKEVQTKQKKKKTVIVIGKRKKAVARAVVREGGGNIRVNSAPLDTRPKYIQMRLKEPIILAGELAKKIDIDVKVRGGGAWGQADAARTAIALGLVHWTKDNKLKEAYIDYDRSLLVSDPRRTEPHKPSRSTAGPRRTKQQSKR